MSSARKLREKPQPPKCLACGMLEDGGRVLFLKHADRQGMERLELPNTLVFPGGDPVAQLAQAFREQAGIDAEIGEVAFERKFNAGSRKRKQWVPCLVFRVNAKNRQAKPGKGFSGFRWLTLEDAKREKLSRRAEWLYPKR